MDNIQGRGIYPTTVCGLGSWNYPQCGFKHWDTASMIDTEIWSRRGSVAMRKWKEPSYWFWTVRREIEEWFFSFSKERKRVSVKHSNTSAWRTNLLVHYPGMKEIRQGWVFWKWLALYLGWQPIVDKHLTVTPIIFTSFLTTCNRVIKCLPLHFQTFPNFITSFLTNLNQCIYRSTSSISKAP